MNEYVIHAKVKNNLILSRILERGYESIHAFCIEHNLDEGRVGGFINMTERAFNPRRGRWTPTALRLAEALVVTVDELFTEEQRVAQLESNQAFIEMTRQQALAMTDPIAQLESTDLVLRMMEHAYLDNREIEVITMRFKQDMTLEECGKKLGVEKERIRQIEAKALRKMRHPRSTDLAYDAGVIERTKKGNSWLRDDR